MTGAPQRWYGFSPIHIPSSKQICFLLFFFLSFPLSLTLFLFTFLIPMYSAIGVIPAGGDAPETKTEGAEFYGNIRRQAPKTPASGPNQRFPSFRSSSQNMQPTTITITEER